MTIKPPKPRITAAQFLNLADTRGYELVDGRPKEKSVGAEATWVQTRLAVKVSVFAEPGRLGEVFGTDCMYQCFPHKPDQVRKPDFSFLLAGRLPGGAIPKGPLTVRPDWVAEVTSPKERVRELTARIEDFLAAGVPLIWVVNPDHRIVTAHTGRVATTFTAADALTGEPVLPGFRLPVADLFPPAPTPEATR
jgi:Uma2 family endonuclease